MWKGFLELLGRLWTVWSGASRMVKIVTFVAALGGAGFVITHAAFVGPVRNHITAPQAAQITGTLKWEASWQNPYALPDSDLERCKTFADNQVVIESADHTVIATTTLEAAPHLEDDGFCYREFVAENVPGQAIYLFVSYDITIGSRAPNQIVNGNAGIFPLT